MIDKQDPFAKLAEEMMTAPIRAQLKAAKTREERRQAQQASDKDVLHRTWKQWHSKRAQTLQTGPYGNDVAEVISFLESMTLQDGGEIVALIERGPWRDADAETKDLLLGLINRRIMYLRQAEGWSPFDDSIPHFDESATAFEIIRGVLQT